MTTENTVAATEQSGTAVAIVSPAERAALALKSSKTEQDLRALAKSSADIVAVLDADGREQAHRIAMNLRTARTTVKAAAEDAREDANAFSRAVIAEERRLIEIVKAEETRVLGLRDAYDAEQERIQAEKIAAERRRTEAHEVCIAAIARAPAELIGKPSAAIMAERDRLVGMTFGPEWEEFAEQANDARAEVVAQVETMYRTTLAAEEEAQRQREAQEAERQRLAAEQVALAAQRAEQEAQRQELARQQAEIAAQREAAAAMAREVEEARQREATAQEQRALAQAAARKREDDERAAEMKRQMDELAAARAEFEAEQNRAAAARRAAEKLERDHAEALAINAAWQPPAPAPVELPPIATQEEAEAIYETAIATEEAQPPAELLDLPEAEPSDAEILAVYLDAFGGDEVQARARLARFGMEAA